MCVCERVHTLMLACVLVFEVSLLLPTAIRSWWEVPCVTHFSYLFRKPFRLPEFDIEVSDSRQKEVLVWCEVFLILFCEVSCSPLAPFTIQYTQLTLTGTSHSVKADFCVQL